MGSNQRRKQQRLLKAKRAQEEAAKTLSLHIPESGNTHPVPVPETNKALSLLVSDSSYRMVGGIAPETFNAAVQSANENRGQGVRKICQPKRKAKAVVPLDVFSSEFTFDFALPKMGKTEAFNRKHAITPTSTRRIEAIFPNDLKSASVTALIDSSGMKNITKAESIFERFEVSKTHAAAHGLEGKHDSENTNNKQQQLVLYRQSSEVRSLAPNLRSSPGKREVDNDALCLWASSQPMNMVSAAILAWVRDQSLRIYKLEAQEESFVRLVDDAFTEVDLDASLRQEGSTKQSENINGSTAAADYERRALVLYRTPFVSSSSEHSSWHSFSKDEGQSELHSSSTWDVARVFMVTMNGVTHLVDHHQTLYSNVQIIDENASDFDSIASPTKLIPPIGLQISDSDVSDLDGEYTTSEECEDSTLQVLLNEPTEEQDAGDGDNDASTHDQEGSQEAMEIIHEVDLESSTEDSHCAQHELINIDEALSGHEDNVKDNKGEANKEFIISSADWARVLTHTMLGTEWFFTYLNNLDIEANGNITKIALASGFLKLVDFEHQKLEETLLPQTYTASSVLESKLLPHKVILGTISLAALLSELDFDANGETGLASIFDAFKKLSEKEIEVRKTATKGVMGDLLRALGKSA